MVYFILQTEILAVPFQEHFKEVIGSVELVTSGNIPNPYYSPDFMRILLRDFLPQTGLWTALMLGNAFIIYSLA